MKGEDDTVTMEFTSGAATLVRHDHLELVGSVHALRQEQVLEADHGLARLTPDEEHITFIELRGTTRRRRKGVRLDVSSTSISRIWMTVLSCRGSYSTAAARWQ